MGRYTQGVRTAETASQRDTADELRAVDRRLAELHAARQEVDTAIAVLMRIRERLVPKAAVR